MSLLQPEINNTAGVQYQTSQEAVLFGMLSMGSSCSFLYINSVLLFTLRSKEVFCETSRYILLYNLLCADTVYMLLNVLLYLLAALRIKTTYYLCGTFVVLIIFAATISPLTLAIMSLERYVAICHPLRHAAIFTIKNTDIVIALVWAFSLFHMLIRVFILVYLLTKVYVSVYINDFCSKEAFFFPPIFNVFDQVYSSTLFLSAGVALITSYTGVALVAKSVSSEKSSARKAFHTLLLHLIQLCLVLISTMFSTIIAAYARTVERLVLLRVYNVSFVCLSILPRCLSSLIYGLNDQTIRPVLMQNLCCRWRCSVVHLKFRVLFNAPSHNGEH